MRIRRISTTLCLLALSSIAAFASGCGGDGSSTAVLSLSPQRNAELKGEAQAPKNASSLLRAIYRQFPAPKAAPSVKGSANAIEAGEAACAGKTPVQVREQFIGSSDLSEDQIAAVARIEQYEKHPSYSFPAGQLAALVYGKTLAESALADYGYQGCVHALARELEEKLAPK
jgi:hypothetical protein